jgi:hypothetical protein
MAIGDGPKLHYAKQIAAALTYVGLANLDRVAVLPFGERLTEIAWRRPRGKNRIFRVFEFLRGCDIGARPSWPTA